jgi:hypothetical protein
MAVQHGPIQLTGQLGGVSYYEMDGKYYARSKTAHSAERIRTDPAFKPTHQNSLEFGRASKASKLLRKAWKEIGGDFADNRMYTRLNGCFKRVVQGDTQHSRGERTVVDGDFTRLLDFELNKHHSFYAWCPSKPVASVNRGRGAVALSLFQGSENASVSRHAPVKLVIGIAVIDFKEEIHHVYRYECKLADFTSGSVFFEAPSCLDSQTAVIITLGVSHSDAAGEKSVVYSNAMAIVGVAAPAAAASVALAGTPRHSAASPQHLEVTSLERLRPSFLRSVPVFYSYPRVQQLRGGIRCRSC